ncbi:MAG TPA: class I SAM-dependent methyltransferase [Acidisarcina sp.]
MKAPAEYPLAALPGQRSGYASQPFSPPANFDSLALWYQWLEYLSFGPMLSRARLHFLGRLTSAKNVLVLGDGDGRFLQQLLRANHEAKARVVDSSSEMLRVLRSRIAAVPQAGQRTTIMCCDALESFSPGALCHQPPFDRILQETVPASGADKFDLVVTHFFLDCLSNADLGILLDRILPHLEPDALWVLSEFAIPEAGPGFGKLKPMAGRLLVFGLYRAFGALTGLRTRSLPDYAAAFRARGFRQAEGAARLGGLLVSEIWANGETQAMGQAQGVAGV